jgi:hypothetical protein
MLHFTRITKKSVQRKPPHRIDAAHLVDQLSAAELDEREQLSLLEAGR